MANLGHKAAKAQRHEGIQRSIIEYYTFKQGNVKQSMKKRRLNEKKHWQNLFLAAGQSVKFDITMKQIQEVTDGRC